MVVSRGPGQVHDRMSLRGGDAAGSGHRLQLKSTAAAKRRTHGRHSTAGRRVPPADRQSHVGSRQGRGCSAPTQGSSLPSSLGTLYFLGTCLTVGAGRSWGAAHVLEGHTSSMQCERTLRGYLETLLAGLDSGRGHVGRGAGSAPASTRADSHPATALAQLVAGGPTPAASITPYDGGWVGCCTARRTAVLAPGTAGSGSRTGARTPRSARAA